MTKDNKKNGVIELWGHEFKKAEEGLDKGEVVSFVDELIKKHETLLNRAEHLSSLTKLAEKTIVEADNVAKQIQSEAEEKAKAEARAILAKAEKQAQELIEEKRAEALARVNREVEVIKAKAQQQAEAMLEEKTREVQPELRNNVKRLYGEFLSQLEGLKKQAVSLEAELDQKLSQPPAETRKASTENGKNGKKFLELIQPDSETGKDEPEWELEILPPIDLTQILDIINYLDNLAEVAQTELVPEINKPTIMVFLREPIYLIDVLKKLPQVVQVIEETTTSNGNSTKPRKVQIELSRKTAPKPSN